MPRRPHAEDRSYDSVARALVTVTMNCVGLDHCMQYQDDVDARLAACHVATTSGTTTAGPSPPSCTDAPAKRSDCLDGCLVNFDCCFLTGPTDATCDFKEMTYFSCVGKC